MASQRVITLPRVSVVIPTCNRAHDVCDAIDSALGQTFRDLEVLVVDDGSTDDTPEVIRRRFGSEPRLELLRQANAGAGAARNRGIRRARGEYVAFLDSDDLWLPEKLELQIAHLDAHPAAGLVFCDLFFEEPGRRVRRFEATRFAGDTSLRGLVERGFPLCTPAVVARRQALLEVGLFDETLRCAQDWDLWIRLLARTPAVYVDRPMGIVRRRGGNLSRDWQLEKWRCWLRVWEKNAAVLLAAGCSARHLRARRAHAHKKIAQTLHERGDYLQARRHYLSWWRLEPWQLRGPVWSAVLSFLPSSGAGRGTGARQPADGPKGRPTLGPEKRS